MSASSIFALVENEVHKSVQCPFYSVFREERTRHANEIEEGAKSMRWRIGEDDGFLFFPHKNNQSTAQSRNRNGTVCLVGGDGFVGKFLAEQFLQRGISVTVATTEFNQAKNLFVPIADGSRDALVTRSKGYISSLHVAQKEETTTVDGSRVFSGHYTKQRKGQSTPSHVQLEIVELQGNHVHHSLEFALRSASLVFYLESTNPNPHQREGRRTRLRREDYMHTINTCRRLDAQLTLLTPLAPSRVAFRRQGVGWGFASVARETREVEEVLLLPDGRPSPLCTDAARDVSESAVRAPQVPASQMRATIIRHTDVVYPSLNEYITVARNSVLADPARLLHVPRGSLDGRVLASTAAKLMGMSRAAGGGRVDIGADFRKGVRHSDSVELIRLLVGLRHEQ
eukprot:gene7209-5066_t